MLQALISEYLLSCFVYVNKTTSTYVIKRQQSLKSEASITLCCQLCLSCYQVRYTAVQIKSTSGIKSSYYEKYRLFPFQKKAIICYYQIDTLAVSSDEWDVKWDTRWDAGKNFYGMLKGMHLSGQSDIECNLLKHSESMPGHNQC